MAFRTLIQRVRQQTDQCRRIGAFGLPLLFGPVLASAACGGSTQFPLREPLQRDDDEVPFGPAPAVYESPFAWDAANQTIFRPIARFFAVDPTGRAKNVNAYDEVPDSSWFTNRLGRQTLSAEQVERGSCGSKRLDPNMPDGSWIIDKGKDNGANPGFRISVPGVGKFMLKSDIASEPDRATGATAVASRIYHALGYFSACDSIVYFRPAVLKLRAGLTVTNNQGVTSAFDKAALDRILNNASHRHGLVRMASSEWLPGKPLGPYTYEGTRDDDPNDVIDHEDRRDLRGARLVAAWLNHFDSREQNTMDVFLPAAKGGKGFVRHYIIDMGDSFGSVWSIDGFSRQFGHAYMLDASYIAEDFVTLGANERPWERARRVGGVFNYFSARDFEPDLWRGEYPNPAFSRMTEADGAWMARILAHFGDDLVEAAVKVGAFDDVNTRYLVETLMARRDAILRRYLLRLSPVAQLSLSGSALCGIDLARQARVVPRETSSVRASYVRANVNVAAKALPITFHPNGHLCVELTHIAGNGGVADNDTSRYMVVDVLNGYALGPLRAHLYDLGPQRGFVLAGIERLERAEPPR